VKEVDGCHSYRAWGRRGQFIVVVPKLDLVVVVTSETRQAVAPTSVHYSPLFDLVAAAVKRDRPPKKPLEAIKLPEDDKAF
jgi:CubicO group peptidase (beta-lactamase class C family)